MENKQDGFSTLVLLIGLVIVGAIGYVSYQVHVTRSNINRTNTNSQTTKYISVPPKTNTSSWKTYNAQKESFSFKYPSNWAATQQNTAGIEDFVAQAPSRQIDGVNRAFSIEMRIIDKSSLLLPHPMQSNIYSIKVLPNMLFSQKLHTVIAGDTNDKGEATAAFINLTVEDVKIGKNIDYNVGIERPSTWIEFEGSYVEDYKNGQKSLSRFNPVQFKSLTEVREAEDIFSTLSAAVQ